MPLPRGFGAVTDPSSRTRNPQKPPPAQTETAEKMKAAQDAKAIKAAKAIRGEMEMAEYLMSGATMGSVASAKSATSSPKFVKSAVGVMDPAGFEGAAVALSPKHSASIKKNEEKAASMAKKPNGAQKKRKDPDQTALKPASTQAAVLAADSTAENNAFNDPKPQPESQTPSYQPMQASLHSSKCSSGRLNPRSHGSAAQTQAKEEHAATFPATWQALPQHTNLPSNPKHLSYVSQMKSRGQEYNPAPICATWQPASVRTVSDTSRTSGSGYISNAYPARGKQIGGVEYFALRPPSVSTGASGFNHLGRAIYGPAPLDQDSNVQTIGSDLETTPSARDETLYLDGLEYAALYPRQLNNGMVDEASTGTRASHFMPAVVSSERSQAGSHFQPLPSHLIPEKENCLGINYNRSLSEESQHHIKQESDSSTRLRRHQSLGQASASPSPQVIHGFNVPSQVSHRSLPRPILNVDQSPTRTGSYQGVAGLPEETQAISLHNSRRNVSSPLRYCSPLQQQQTLSYHSGHLHAMSLPQSHGPPSHELLPKQESNAPPPSLLQPQSVVEYMVCQQSSRRGSIHQPVTACPPTVYAGRGWISPHPLSIAPSDISDPPQSTIHLPTAHHFRRNGDSANAVPGALTYEEWRAVQDQQSVLTEHIGEYQDGSQRSGHESNSCTRPNEVLHRGPDNRWEGSTRGWDDRPRTNWSRTTSSHAREWNRTGRNWGYDGVGTVRNDGKVQLKMPWDQ